MQLFDYLMLNFNYEYRYAHGLSMSLTYALSTAITLIYLASLLRGDDLGQKPSTKFHGLDTRVLNDYRAACRDFDREVAAWEQAVRQKGERR